MEGFRSVPAPKAIVYFADSLRARPGGHYEKLVEKELETAFVNPTALQRRRSLTVSDAEFRKFLQDALAAGVRLYMVQGRVRTETGPAVRDAADTLSSAAGETGGAAFLDGASDDAVAERLGRDAGCFYLLSFDASGLKKDTPLRLIVRGKSGAVKLSGQGTIVVPSKKPSLDPRRGRMPERSARPRQAPVGPGADRVEGSGGSGVTGRERRIPLRSRWCLSPKWPRGRRGP